MSYLFVLGESFKPNDFGEIWLESESILYYTERELSVQNCIIYTPIYVLEKPEKKLSKKMFKGREGSGCCYVES